jgi:uncharacterized membrane protein YhiD involved in acid resistance
MEDFLAMLGPARVLGPLQILTSILASFALCMAIAATYQWTFRGLSYSRSFVHAIVLGGMISCILIMAIGNNLARGLGILGTLAVVRFRTHIRDPRDIIFLFASLAMGIAAGASVYSVAIIGTACFCAAVLFLQFSPFASRREYEGMLRFQMPPGATPVSTEVHTALQTYCASYELIAVREAVQGELVEYAYQIRLVDPSYQADLMEKLNSLEGVTDSHLLMHRSTVEL